MGRLTEKDLPEGWFILPVRDVAGDSGWVVYDQAREPMVHEFSEQAALKAAVEYSKEVKS